MDETERRNFWLVLPSNAKTTPSNTLCDYTTRIPKTLKLGGSWEVALAEIQFPKTWNNLHKENYFTIETSEQNATVIINPGYYATMQDLLNEISDFLNPEIAKHFKLEHDDKRRRIIATVQKGCTCKISKELSQVLGFGDEDSVIREGRNIGRFAADLERNQHALFIYTDIIESTIVGHTEVPLLNIVPTKGPHGHMIHRTLQPLHFVRIETPSFQTVRIYIRGADGAFIPFEDGIVIVKLLFRPVKRLL